MMRHEEKVEHSRHPHTRKSYYGDVEWFFPSNDDTASLPHKILLRQSRCDLTIRHTAYLFTL